MDEALESLLRDTSRSFYLTLRILPAAIRPQIGLAYLLARTTDTIADTEVLPVAERLAALQTLRARILGQGTEPLAWANLSARQSSPAEQRLLQKVEAALAVLKTFTARDLQDIRHVLVTITSGQELDLQRFAAGRQNKIIPLETARELDDYTYRVAGCVGEFWTHLCRRHLFPQASLDDQQFLQDGICFGKGLQLVNILRDLPTDLKNGRCYLPTERLEPAGLRPETLFSPVLQDRFKPLYQGYLDQAEAHLLAGWRYTLTLPYRQFRVRLACAWPILIGLQTLAKLRHATPGDLQARVKITRHDVWRILILTLLACPLPFWWRRLARPTPKIS